MRLPRDRSGRDLVKALEKAYGYRRIHQRGSHIILETDSPRRHRISFPDHDALRLGTLHSILRAVGAVQQDSRERVLRKLFP